MLVLERRDDRSLPCRFFGGAGDVVGAMIRGGRLGSFYSAEDLIQHLHVRGIGSLAHF